MLDRILSENEEAIAKTWVGMVASTYAGETASFLIRERDPFANPMGDVIRKAAPLLVKALGTESPGPEAIDYLDRLLRLRSLQDWTAGEAVGIVHRLRTAVLKQVGDRLDRDALIELAERVDALSLKAFEVFTSCREQLYEVRLHERDRHHASLLRRAEQRLGQDRGLENNAPAESQEGGRIA